MIQWLRKAAVCFPSHCRCREPCCKPNVWKIHMNTTPVQYCVSSASLFQSFPGAEIQVDWYRTDSAALKPSLWFLQSGASIRQLLQKKPNLTQCFSQKQQAGRGKWANKWLFRATWRSQTLGFWDNLGWKGAQEVSGPTCSQQGLLWGLATLLGAVSRLGFKTSKQGDWAACCDAWLSSWGEELSL